MMAARHVTSAAAVYATVVGVGANGLSVGGVEVPALWSGWSGAEPIQLILGTIVVAAGALVPDLDHPNSTLTRKLGPAGKIVYPVIKFLSGGHRKGMHSIFFVLTMGALFYAADLLAASLGNALYGTAFAAVLVALSALLVTRFVLPLGLGKRRNAAYLVALVLVAALFLTDGVMSGYWLPVAAAAGPLLHDLGDGMTDGKVGFLWPVRPPFAVIPKFLRFPTGGFFEERILGPIFILWMTAAVVVFSALPLISG